MQSIPPTNATMSRAVDAFAKGGVENVGGPAVGARVALSSLSLPILLVELIVLLITRT